MSDPGGRLQRDAHDRNVTEFRSTDRAHIGTGPRRVLRAVAEHITATRDRYPDQSQLVAKQAALTRNHLPIRDLFQAAPDVLGALKPCWAMSPLVVSQLLPMQLCFDVVIFDEASQVTPADAVGALARAGRAIVAGDPHQLPPTSFFAASGGGVDDEDEPDTTGAVVRDIESVLDQMTALLPPPIGTRTLAWHYRSRDEKLIAFSNAQPSLYDYSLTTFPGARGQTRSATSMSLSGRASGARGLLSPTKWPRWSSWWPSTPGNVRRSHSASLPWGSSMRTGSRRPSAAPAKKTTRWTPS